MTWPLGLFINGVQCTLNCLPVSVSTEPESIIYPESITYPTLWLNHSAVLTSLLTATRIHINCIYQWAELVHALISAIKMPIKDGGYESQFICKFYNHSSLPTTNIPWKWWEFSGCKSFQASCTSALMMHCFCRRRLLYSTDDGCKSEKVWWVCKNGITK